MGPVAENGVRGMGAADDEEREDVGGARNRFRFRDVVVVAAAVVTVNSAAEEDMAVVGSLRPRPILWAMRLARHRRRRRNTCFHRHSN